MIVSKELCSDVEGSVYNNSFNYWVTCNRMFLMYMDTLYQPLQLNTSYVIKQQLIEDKE